MTVTEFTSNYRYIDNNTWPNHEAFNSILESLLNNSSEHGSLNNSINYSTLICIALFHLIWNHHHDEKLTSKVGELVAACSPHFLPITHYFQGKLKALQADHESALKFYNKATVTMNNPNDIDNFELTSLLVAMGSIDRSKSVFATQVFSTILLIDTAYSCMNLNHGTEAGNLAAIQKLITALNSQRSIYGTDNHPNVAYTLRLLARAYINIGDLKQALPIATRANDIAKCYYADKPSHPEYLAVQELMQDCLKDEIRLNCAS